MMNNRNRAINIIEHSIKNGHSAADIAQHLEDYGLLADDPLEPSYTVTASNGERPVWQATTRFLVEADPDSKDICIWNDYSPTEMLSLAKVNAMRQALYAAEVYLKKA